MQVQNKIAFGNNNQESQGSGWSRFGWGLGTGAVAGGIGGFATAGPKGGVKAAEDLLNADTFNGLKQAVGADAIQPLETIKTNLEKATNELTQEVERLAKKVVCKDKIGLAEKDGVEVGLIQSHMKRLAAGKMPSLKGKENKPLIEEVRKFLADKAADAKVKLSELTEVVKGSSLVEKSKKAVEEAKTGFDQALEKLPKARGSNAFKWGAIGAVVVGAAVAIYNYFSSGSKQAQQ